MILCMIQRQKYTNLHHDWSEREVLKYESKIMTRLSKKQMSNLLLALARALEND